MLTESVLGGWQALYIARSPWGQCSQNWALAAACHASVRPLEAVLCLCDLQPLLYGAAVVGAPRAHAALMLLAVFAPPSPPSLAQPSPGPPLPLLFV